MSKNGRRVFLGREYDVSKEKDLENCGWKIIIWFNLVKI